MNVSELPPAAPPRGASLLAALVAVTLWGASFVAVRLALESFEPLGLLAVRLVLGALFLGGVLVARGEALVPVRRDLGPGIALGLVFGLHLMLQAFALVHTTAVHAGWIVAFIPIVIALAGRIFHGTRLRAGGWSGAALATAGVALLLSKSPPNFDSAGLGDLLVLASCFTWTAYTLGGLGPTSRSGALCITFFAMAVASLPALGAALWSGFLVDESSAVTPGAFGAVVFLGLFCSGLATWLWNLAVRHDGATRTGALLYLQPFVTVAGSLLLLSEPLQALTLVAGGAVLAGVAWMRSAARPT